MTASINWMCKVCAHRIDGLSLKELLTIDGKHECTVADLIRRAARHYRSRGNPADVAVAEWLDSDARQAGDMTGPTDFGITDEPGSVQYALAVAHALPAEEDRS